MLDNVDWTPILQVIIPTLSSIGTIWIIGNRIKTALCSQISEVANQFKTHVGISEIHINRIDELETDYKNLVLKNNLKV